MPAFLAFLRGQMSEAIRRAETATNPEARDADLKRARELSEQIAAVAAKASPDCPEPSDGPDRDD